MYTKTKTNKQTYYIQYVSLGIAHLKGGIHNFEIATDIFYPWSVKCHVSTNLVLNQIS